MNVCESMVTDDANTDADGQRRLRGPSFSSIVSDTPLHFDVKQSRFFEASEMTVSTFEGDSLHSLGLSIRFADRERVRHKYSVTGSNEQYIYDAMHGIVHQCNESKC